MEYELILQTVRERAGMPDSTNKHRTHCRCGLSPKEARDDGKIPQARRKRVTLE
jgi:hypothetical protein